MALGVLDIDCMSWLCFAIAVLLVKFLGLHLRYRNFPPGPWGLPFLGYLPFVKKKGHILIANLGKKYGNVFSLYYGSQRILILNDYEAIHEAFVKKGDAFAGRPRLFMISAISNHKDVMSSDGSVWKEQRRFTLHHLRNFGLGKTCIESAVHNEVEDLIERLSCHGDQVVNFEKLLVVPVMNVIWNISVDKRYSTENQTVAQFKSDIDTLILNTPSSAVLNYFPLLRFIFPKLLGYSSFLESNTNLLGHFTREIERHWGGCLAGQQRDLLDVYLEEIWKREAKGKARPPFTVDHLKCTLKNLFVAGTETTVTTLKWALLMMALRPDIQAKIHSELDSRIGSDSVPRMSCRSQLPYLEATIMEIHRYFSIVPLAIPHATMTDVRLFGYDIPKETVVLANIWAVHHSDEYWERPMEFLPERFIGEDGQLKKPPYLMPFSAGPRFCLGEPLAKLEVFLFFASIMHKFRLEVDPNGPVPSLEPMEGVILMPKPFSLKVIRKQS